MCCCNRPRRCFVRVPIFIQSPLAPTPVPQPVPLSGPAYGGFYSTGDATIPLAANVPHTLNLNTAPMPHRNVIDNGNSLRVEHSGDYFLSYTVSASTIGGGAFITFYVTQNGAEILSSRASSNLNPNHVQVFSSASIVHLYAGDMIALGEVSNVSVGEYIVHNGLKLMIEKIS